MDNMNKSQNLIDSEAYEYNDIYKNIKDALKEISNFIDEYKEEKYIKDNYEIIQKQMNNTNSLIKNSDYFYLPLIGLSNSGKTTIINNLVGYNILPNGISKTTKRGILIKYCEKGEPVIYKVKFIFGF
jgi:ribosome biogenesis GTPase A